VSIEKISDLYYTAAEARKILGLTEHSFQYWVKSGKINKTILPGKRQGVYLKREIDRKAQQIERALFFADAKDLEFKPATVNDMDAESHLASLIFGRDALSQDSMEASRRLARISPESTYHLYDRDILVASINIVPLKHEAILEFIQGKRGWLFTEESIVPFQAGKPLECIIIDFMATPAVPPEQRHEYAIRLLFYFLDKLEEWGKRGIEISKVYANGGTDIGQRLLESAGGKVVNIVHSEKHPRKMHTIYEVDVASSTKRFIQPYKVALAKWKQQRSANSEQ
jgi:hypothetical protein